LGRRSRGRTKPIIARFTRRADRDKVWKLRGIQQVNISEDLPKRVQDLRKNVLAPAMKKARSDPRTKAHVSGDKLVINGKAYFHYNILARWLPSNSEEQEETQDGETPVLNAPATDFTDNIFAFRSVMFFVHFCLSTLCKLYQILQRKTKKFMLNFF